MRALITGGCGFIGSHLATVLLQRGDKVDVLDNLSTGTIDNVEHLEKHSNFSMTIGSVMDTQAVSRLTRKADVVFHLAAVVGVDLVIANPLCTIETSVVGTKNILRCAAKQRTPVLLASSSEVYGNASRLPSAESDTLALGRTACPRWSYAFSKAIDEALAFAYHSERGLPLVVARLFNTVGPRQTGRYGMVLPRFVRRALSGDPLLVYGDGRQTRSFTHVDDTVRMLVALMDEPKAHGDVFNVGSSQQVQIIELAKLVRSRANSASEIQLIPYTEAHPEGFAEIKHRVPDTSKATSLTRIHPSMEIRAIVDSVIAWATTGE